MDKLRLARQKLREAKRKIEKDFLVVASKCKHRKCIDAHTCKCTDEKHLHTNSFEAASCSLDLCPRLNKK